MMLVAGCAVCGMRFAVCGMRYAVRGMWYAVCGARLINIFVCGANLLILWKQY